MNEKASVFRRWPVLRAYSSRANHPFEGGYDSIFLDPETNTLFGYLEIEDARKMAPCTRNSNQSKSGWVFMEDLMETNQTILQ